MGGVLNKLAVRVSICLALVVLGVIFALCFRLPSQLALQTGDNAYTVGPITSRTAFVQQLNVAGPGRISSVEVLLATWDKRANTTHDEIRIFDGDGRQVQAKKLPPGSVADNVYVRVDLPDPIEFDGPDRFFVSLSSSDGSAAHSITAWVTSATVAGRLYSLPSADLGHGSLVKKIDHARPLRGAICVRVLGQGPRRLLDEQTLRVGGLLVFLALAACAWWVLSFAQLPDFSSVVRPAPPDLKNRRLHLLVLVVLAGTVTSLLFHYVAGRVLHWEHVRASFLLGVGGPLEELGNTFMDLINPLASARASLHGVVWLPPTPFFHVVYLALVPLGRAGALLLQSGVFLAGMVLLLWETYVDALSSRVERLTYLLVLLALSYPVLFVLERGNIEMVLFIVMAGFLYLYYVKGSVWCVGLLAIAISMKMFPAVFLVLLLADRRYRWTLYAVLGAACTALVSLALLALLLGRGYVDLIHTNVIALSEISRVYAVSFYGLPYGHSLWGLLVFLAGLAGIDQNTFAAGAAFPYTILVFVAFAALAVFVIRLVELPWQRVALLTVAALALPTVSADYRLLYAYLPLAMLLNAPVRTRVDMTCVALLGCLLVPMDYVYGVVLRVPGWPADHTSVSVVVYPLVMIALVAVIAWDVLVERGRFAGLAGAGSAPPALPRADEEHGSLRDNR